MKSKYIILNSDAGLVIGALASEQEAPDTDFWPKSSSRPGDREMVSFLYNISEQFHFQFI